MGIVGPSYFAGVGSFFYLSDFTTKLELYELEKRNCDFFWRKKNLHMKKNWSILYGS